jgi:hypothetical protein
MLKVQILSTAFVLVFLLGLVPQAVFAGQAIPNEDVEIFPKPFEGYDLDPISHSDTYKIIHNHANLAHR